MTKADLIALAELTRQRFADAQRSAFSLHSECLAPDSPTSNPEVLNALHILSLIEGAKAAIDEAVRDLNRLRSMIDEKAV